MVEGVAVGVAAGVAVGVAVGVVVGVAVGVAMGATVGVAAATVGGGGCSVNCTGSGGGKSLFFSCEGKREREEGRMEDEMTTSSLLLTYDPSRTSLGVCGSSRSSASSLVGVMLPSRSELGLSGALCVPLANRQSHDNHMTVTQYMDNYGDFIILPKGTCTVCQHATCRTEDQESAGMHTMASNA